MRLRTLKCVFSPTLPPGRQSVTYSAYPRLLRVVQFSSRTLAFKASCFGPAYFWGQCPIRAFCLVRRGSGCHNKGKFDSVAGLWSALRSVFSARRCDCAARHPETWHDFFLGEQGNGYRTQLRSELRAQDRARN